MSLDAIKAVPKGSDGKKVPAVIVLLSDGATTVGQPTADAIPEAKKAGVSVYTIAYGTPNGVVDVTIPETGEQTRIPVPVDGQALADLANGTGGKSFTAAERDRSQVGVPGARQLDRLRHPAHRHQLEVRAGRGGDDRPRRSRQRTVVPATSLTGILARR